MNRAERRERLAFVAEPLSHLSCSSGVAAAAPAKLRQEGVASPRMYAVSPTRDDVGPRVALDHAALGRRPFAEHEVDGR